MEIGQIVQVDVGSKLSAELARAAGAPEVSHALFVRADRAVAFVPAEELTRKLTKQVAAALEDRYRLSAGTISIEREDSAHELRVSRDPARDLAVVRHAGANYVLQGLAAGAPRSYAIAYSADTRLPEGDPSPPPDPIVTYRCANGDRVRQRLSSTNRSCPICRAPITRS
jgi:hypothetical protein